MVPAKNAVVVAVFASMMAATVAVDVVVMTAAVDAVTSVVDLRTT